MSRIRSNFFDIPMVSLASIPISRGVTCPLEISLLDSFLMSLNLPYFSHPPSLRSFESVFYYECLSQGCFLAIFSATRDWWDAEFLSFILEFWRKWLEFWLLIKILNAVLHSFVGPLGLSICNSSKYTINETFYTKNLPQKCRNFELFSWVLSFFLEFWVIFPLSFFLDGQKSSLFYKRIPLLKQAC